MIKFESVFHKPLNETPTIHSAPFKLTNTSNSYTFALKANVLMLDNSLQEQLEKRLNFG